MNRREVFLALFAVASIGLPVPCYAGPTANSPTKVGVVIGRISRFRRAIIIPDDTVGDDHWATVNLLPGEELVLVDKASTWDQGIRPTDNLISALTGALPPNGTDRCAVVDQTGGVVAVIHADPLIDAVDGHSLLLHESVDVGWRLIDGALVNPRPLAT